MTVDTGSQPNVVSKCSVTHSACDSFLALQSASLPQRPVLDIVDKRPYHHLHPEALSHQRREELP